MDQTLLNKITGFLEDASKGRGALPLFLFNPALDAKTLASLDRLQREHVSDGDDLWVASSGTSGQQQFFALSRKALLTSAQSVNRHLQVERSDRWLCPLPLFHVGGLGIVVRAHAAQNSFFTIQKWEPTEFQRFCAEKKITLSSLVPTQVFDLVKAQLAAPPSLRAIVVGGAALSEKLYAQARTLGWPLLPSYGLTECCSQVATAELSSLELSESSNANAASHKSDIMGAQLPALRILDHCKVTLVEERVAIESSALFSKKLEIVGHDVREEQAPTLYLTQDFGVLRHSGSGAYLSIQGRTSDFGKIKGEKVSLPRLRDIFLDLLSQQGGAIDFHLNFIRHERSGLALHLTLAGVNQSAADKLVSLFNSKVAPFEQIHEYKITAQIPRSALGKVVPGKN